ncbi:MAG: hypothetical protein IKS33_04375 [Bacteroidales bacterium]|nr:hypothetical protein [Bacteroidales bacterium]
MAELVEATYGGNSPWCCGEATMACPYKHFFYKLTILFFISFFLLLLQSQTFVALIGTDGKIKLKD